MRRLLVGLAMLAMVASACVVSQGGNGPLQNITAEPTDAPPIAHASMPPDATTPPATPTPTPTATPVQPTPIVVKGKGSQNTKPFNLAGGDYAVVVKGKPGDSYGGNVIMHLILTTDPSSTEGLTNEIAPNGSAYTYETNLYGLAPGKYYLEALMPGGTWSVTFKPQS